MDERTGEIVDKTLKVRELKEGTLIDGLSHFLVTCYEDIQCLMEEGLNNRTVGSTAMNATSSRSHSIFILNITQMATDGDDMSVSGKASKVISSPDIGVRTPVDALTTR